MNSNNCNLTDQRIELKFPLTDVQAEDIKSWAKEKLEHDPHCNDEGRDHYHVRTLYLDSPSLDIYHRRFQQADTKYRIRRYSDEQVVWVETKNKRRNVVTKRRSPIVPSGRATLLRELDYSSRCASLDPSYRWFCDSVHQWSLRPRAIVNYQRFAKVSSVRDPSLRLTIDNQLTASVADDWSFLQEAHSQHDQRGLAIASRPLLELKFHNTLPPIFKELILRFGLVPSGFSKYRSSIDTFFPQLGDSIRSQSSVHSFRSAESTRFPDGVMVANCCGSLDGLRVSGPESMNRSA